MSESIHGIFYWNELLTRDVEAAKAFYAETLGWSYDLVPMDDGIYTLCSSGDELAGGIFELKPGDGFEGIANHWLSYIAVDDIDARVAKVEAAGGKVKRPPFDVPGIGRIAIVEDKTGAAIGWMTPADED